MSYIEVARGIRLFYEDWGSGPVILFLHGWTMSHKVWAYQTSELAYRFRTIALDLRGHGSSDKPFSAYSYQEYANDIQNFIRKLDLWEVTLVGWSMGAAIGIEYLRLFGDRVAKFVSVAGAVPKYVAGPDWPYGLPLDTIQAWLTGLRHQRPELAEEFSSAIFKSDTVGRMTKHWIWEIIMEASWVAATRSLMSLRDADLRDFVPKIRVPTAIFHGARDDITYLEAATWMAAHLPQARLIIFTESGHAPFIDEIDKFNREIERFILE
ncbi:MAG: alpha/beta hydrolase [Firmicutes bacterium]|nr:alpha/beta hydrolase [Bacillota bacterium]